MLTSESFIKQFQLTNRLNDFAWATSTPVIRSSLPKMTTAIIVSLRSQRQKYAAFIFVYFHVTALFFFLRCVSICFNSNLVIDAEWKWLVPFFQFFSTGFIEDIFLPQSVQITLIFGILLMFMIYAFGFIVSFRPAYYYYPRKDTIFAVALLCGSFSIHITSAAFFTATRKVVTNGDFYDWTVSALCLLFSYLFVAVTKAITTCYPSFCTVPGAYWFLLRNKGISLNIMFTVVSSTVNVLGSSEMKMLNVILHAVFMFGLGTVYIWSLNYVSLYSAGLFGSFYFTASTILFMAFASFFCDVHAWQVLSVIAIMIPIMWFVVYRVIKWKVTQVRMAVSDCIKTGDYTSMPKSEKRFLLYCCHSLDIIETEDIWKYGERVFPNSFQFYYNYFRFLSRRQDLTRMYDMIINMHEVSSNSLYEETILMLLQVWLFYMPDIDLTGLLSSVIDSCLMILHLFWCESLHGQIDRLLSLSTSAHAKFCEVIALLYNIKCVKGDHLDGNESYQKLTSLISEQRIDKFVANFGERMKAFVCDTAWLDQGSRPTDKLFTLRRLINFPERRLRLLSVCQHISLYGPYYFSFFVGTLLIWMFHNYSALFAGYAYIFSSMAKIGIISGFEHLSTVLPKDHEILQLVPRYSANESARLVQSVATVSKDLFQRYSKIRSFLLLDKLYRQLDGCFLYQSLQAMRKQRGAGDMAMLEQPLDPYAVSDRSVPAALTNALETSMMVSVGELLIFCLALAIVVIVICSVCQWIASKMEHHFLAEFSALPKTAITELIDKIGDRLAIPGWILESVDPEVRFNLRILSYQGSSNRYPTEGKRKLKAFTYICIMTFSLTLGIFISAHASMYIASEQLSQLCALWDFVAIPVHLLRLGSCMFRFFGDPTTANFQSFNAERVRLDNVFLPLLSSSKLNRDMIKQYFLISTCEDILGDRACFEDVSQCVCKSFSEKLMVFLAEGPELRNYLWTSTEDPYVTRSQNAFVRSITHLINSSTTVFVEVCESETIFTHSHYLILLTWCFILLMCGTAALYAISRRSIHSIKLPRNCTLAARSTLPENFVVGQNSKLDEANVSQRDLDKGAEFLNSYSAFEQLGESVILIGDRNRIVGCTPVTRALLKQKIEGVFPDFLQRLCGERIEIQPGKKAEFTVYINTANQGKNALIKFVLIPLDNFKFREEKVNFACIATDVTERKFLASEVNLEANRLRTFMTQLVPAPIAEQIMEGRDFELKYVECCVVGSILMESSSTLSLETVCHIQKTVRHLLHEYPKIVFIGRSCLTFRVAIETAPSEESSSEELVELVNFCLRVIESVRKHNNTVTVHCGVHITGPFVCDVLKDVLPAYGLFGPEINISAIVGSLGKPNRVNITRAVYDTLPHSIYDLSFYDEVKHHNHGIRVYQIHKLKQ